MRKKDFYVLVFLGVFFLLGKYECFSVGFKIDLSSSSFVYLKNGENEDVSKDSSFAENLMQTVTVGPFKMRCSQKIDGKIQNPTEEFLYSYGALFDFGKISDIPLTVLGGKISVSGSYSKIKNPCLSIPSSAFSGISTAASNLNFYLLSIPSEKPDCFASSFVFFNSKSVIRNFSLSSFYDMDENFASSVLLSVKPNKFSLFSTSATYSSGWVKNQSTYWFSKTILFPDKRLNFGNLQFFYKMPFFSSKISTNFYQTPYSDCGFCGNAEFDFHYSVKNVLFSCDFAGFLASQKFYDGQVFSITQDELKTLVQAKIHPEFTVLLKNYNSLRLRFAFLYFFERKLSQSQTFQDSERFFGSTSFLQKEFSLKINFSAKIPKYDSEENYKFSLETSLNNFLKPAFGSSYYVSFYDESVSAQKINFFFSLKPIVKSKNHSFCIKNTTSINFKQDEFNYGTNNLSASYKTKNKFSNISVNLGVKYKWATL